MFVVTGATGHVGSVVVQKLLAAGKEVRAVSRRITPNNTPSNCEYVAADFLDIASLHSAFNSAKAIFILLPPNFDPSDDFDETRQIINNIKIALIAAAPEKIVCLSTIGAQAKQKTILSQLSIMEKELGNLQIPITFLRAAWFMENAQWDISSAKEKDFIYSFLSPLERGIPMISTKDVGGAAAKLMQEEWVGVRHFELSIKNPVSPKDIENVFSKLLYKPIATVQVPEENWMELFLQQGMKNPKLRINMLKGFNEGWICFEGSPAIQITGDISLEEAITDILKL